MTIEDAIAFAAEKHKGLAQAIAVERIERRVVDVGLEDAFLEILEHDQPRTGAEVAKRLLVGDRAPATIPCSTRSTAAWKCSMQRAKSIETSNCFVPSTALPCRAPLHSAMSLSHSANSC